MRLYTRLLRLYPADIRYAYGSEMRQDFEQRVATSRQRGRWVAAATVVRLLGALIVDLAAQRAHTLYSHRSFHGRRQPDPGVVRPPNMGKGEWFGS